MPPALFCVWTCALMTCALVICTLIPSPTLATSPPSSAPTTTPHALPLPAPATIQAHHDALVALDLRALAWGAGGVAARCEVTSPGAWRCDEATLSTPGRRWHIKRWERTPSGALVAEGVSLTTSGAAWTIARVEADAQGARWMGITTRATPAPPQPTPSALTITRASRAAGAASWTLDGLRWTPGEATARSAFAASGRWTVEHLSPGGGVSIGEARASAGGVSGLVAPSARWAAGEAVELEASAYLASPGVLLQAQVAPLRWYALGIALTTPQTPSPLRLSVGATHDGDALVGLVGVHRLGDDAHHADARLEWSTSAAWWQTRRLEADAFARAWQANRAGAALWTGGASAARLRVALDQPDALSAPVEGFGWPQQRLVSAAMRATLHDGRRALLSASLDHRWHEDPSALQPVEPDHLTLFTLRGILRFGHPRRLGAQLGLMNVAQLELKRDDGQPGWRSQPTASLTAWGRVFADLSGRPTLSTTHRVRPELLLMGEPVRGGASSSTWARGPERWGLAALTLHQTLTTPTLTLDAPLSATWDTARARATLSGAVALRHRAVELGALGLSSHDALDASRWAARAALHTDALTLSWTAGRLTADDLAWTTLAAAPITSWRLLATRRALTDPLTDAPAHRHILTAALNLSPTSALSTTLSTPGLHTPDAAHLSWRAALPVLGWGWRADASAFEHQEQWHAAVMVGLWASPP